MSTTETLSIRVAAAERGLARELAELIGEAPDGQEWAGQGACRSRLDDLMWPTAEPGTAEHTLQSAPARAMCADCPVRAQCLNYALSNGEADGIWGGLDEAERRRLSRTSVSSHPEQAAA